MNCPNCNSDIYVRNGVINNVQRFKCKRCHLNYTVEQKSSSISNTKKRIALILYLEGQKVSSIAEFLEVSHVSVSNWIKKYGNNLKQLRAQLDIGFDDIE